MKYSDRCVRVIDNPNTTNYLGNQLVVKFRSCAPPQYTGQCNTPTPATASEVFHAARSFHPFLELRSWNGIVRRLNKIAPLLNTLTVDTIALLLTARNGACHFTCTNERLLSGLSKAPHMPGEHAVLRLTTKASSVKRMTPLLGTMFAQQPIPVAVTGGISDGSLHRESCRF
jgi:hypothetical protein